MMIIAMSSVCWGVLFSIGYAAFGLEWCRLLALAVSALGFAGVVVHVAVVLWVSPRGPVLTSGTRPLLGEREPREMVEHLDVTRIDA